MTLPVTENITCPECGHEQEFTIWRSLNVTLNPELKDPLIRGELTTFTCEACGETTHVVYGMLYHDMDQELMISLSRDDVPPLDDLGPLQSYLQDMMKSYRFRLVRTRNELVEKVRIFDAGLDDRVVQLFKVVLRAQLAMADHATEGQLLFYGRVDEDGGAQRMEFVLLTDDDQVPFSVPWAEYAEFAPILAQDLPPLEAEAGQWLRVDDTYAPPDPGAPDGA